MRLQRLTGLERREDRGRSTARSSKLIERAARDPGQRAARWSRSSSEELGDARRSTATSGAPRSPTSGRRLRRRGPDRRRGRWSSRSATRATSSALPVDTYRRQGRGGQRRHRRRHARKRTSSSTCSSPPRTTTSCSSPTGGACYWLKVYEMPEAGRAARGQVAGQPARTCARTRRSPRSCAAQEFDENHFLVIVTKKGTDQEDDAGRTTATRARPASSPST